jgi:hypothetical protein
MSFRSPRGTVIVRSPSPFSTTHSGTTTMRRLAPTFVMGTIATASIVTIVVGAQLQSNQCAQISLPLDFNISLGKACATSQTLTSR